MRTVPGRLALVGGVVATAVAVSAGPASAHVEVSADKARAGATDVTVSFAAESESSTAGIVSLRVALPAGIAPAQVSWLSGPSGWALTRGADGYTVAGPALPAGKDAEYTVRIAKLPPDATVLAFKTLQTYRDGHIDRWIEIPEGGAAEPENPAPMLTLAAAAAPSAAPAPPSPVASTASDPAPTSAAAAAGREAVGGSAGWRWIGVALLVLAASTGVVVWARRRRSAGRPGTEG